MNEVIEHLLSIEQDYYEGTSFHTLRERILEVAAIIASLEEHDAAQQACRTFAPLLWGATSGTDIDPNAIKKALDGPEGGEYLRAWVNIGSVIPTFRIAA